MGWQLQLPQKMGCSGGEIVCGVIVVGVTMCWLCEWPSLYGAGERLCGESVRAEFPKR